MRGVVLQLEEAFTLSILAEETELSHELTAVADAERERVGTCIERFDSLASTLIVKDTRSPAFGRA